MQQIWIPKAGGPEVFEVRETEDPAPEAGELRIRVKASGINFADVMARQGLYPDAPPFPFVVGYEVAGTVDAVGEGVDEDWIGTEVASLTRFGGYSSVVCVPEGHAARIPEGVTPEQAAAIPTQGLTAWMMLMEYGRIREGDRVLVHSAGGGVGLMCLDLLKWKGCYAIGTASAHKHDFLTERGYDQLVDYRNHDFYEVLKDEPGLDLILDPIGGASWGKGLKLLRAAGKLVCFGYSARSTGQTRSFLDAIRPAWEVPWLKFNPITMMTDNFGVCGVNMGHMWDDGDRVAGWLVALFELLEQGVVRPQIHAALPFSEVTEAHSILHRRENVGKVLLIPDEVAKG